MKNKQGTLLLAVILAAPAFAFADNIPGHSKTGNNYVSFSEGLIDQGNSQGNSAKCNFLLGASGEKGLSATTVARSFSSETDKGEKSSMSAVGSAPEENFVNLVDFAGNNRVSQDTDKDKSKGKGKHAGGSGNGNGPTSGSGTSSPVIAVGEPGSQSLLLFGLAGLGMLVFRRKTFTNAI